MIEAIFNKLEEIKFRREADDFFSILTNYMTTQFEIEEVFIFGCSKNSEVCEIISSSLSGEELDEIALLLNQNDWQRLLRSKDACILPSLNFCSSTIHFCKSTNHIKTLAIPTYSSAGEVNGIIAVLIKSEVRLNKLSRLLRVVSHTLGFKLEQKELICKLKLQKNLAIKNAEMLNEVQEITKVGGWEIHVATGELIWTDRTFEILEVEKNKNQKPSNPEWLELFVPEHIPIIKEAIENAVSHGKSFSFELQALTARGNKCWVYINGRAVYENGIVIRLQGTIQDVDDKVKKRRKIEHLKQLGKSTRKALNTHAIVSATDLSGKITYANRKFCNISGYTKDELIGKTHSIVKSGAHSPSFYKKMYSKINKGETWHGIFQNRTKNGDNYWVRSTISPTFSDSGALIGFISIRTDISNEIKTIENEIEESVQREHFISTISHELRTPLNGINGYTTLLKTTELDDKQMYYISVIQDCVDDMIGQVNKILELQNLRESDYGMVSIKDIFEIAFKRLAPEFQRYNPVLNISIKDISIAAGRNRLMGIMENLLSNAAKYNFPKGYIDFEISHDEENVVFNVKNSCHGIHNDQMGLIFEPFKRGANSKGNIPGAGVGLTIVKQSVNELNGTITVESDGNSYARFIIKLPLKEVNV